MKNGLAYTRHILNKNVVKSSYFCCTMFNLVGVRVKKSSGCVDVHAPLVISDAGVVNTFTTLLPQQVAQKSSKILLTKVQ